MDQPLPPVSPPLSRDLLAQRIRQALADNNSQLITPEDIRSRLLEIVDSVAMLGPASGTAGVFLNAMSYGAAGDGVTDDTAALQAVVAQAQATSTPLFFPPGRYLCTAGLDAAGQTGPLEVYGPGATLLHGFASSAGPALFGNARGTVGAAVLPTTDILSGATTIPLVSASGFAAGDFITIRDNNQPHYGTSYNQIVGYEGEVLFVASVASNTLTLWTSVEENYLRVSTGGFTNNNVDIRKLNLLSGLNIHDIAMEDVSSVEGSTSARGIALYCELRPRVRNVTFRNFQSFGVGLEWCPDFEVVDVSFENLSDSGGYGVMLKQGSSGHVVRPVMRHGRHCVTTQDGEYGEIPPRHCDIIGGRVYGNIATAYDTHGNGKYIRFIDCEDYSHRRALPLGTLGDCSFQIRCKNASVINPRVSGGGHSIGVNAPNGARNFTLIGGDIRGCDVGVHLNTCDGFSVTGTRFWPMPGATAAIEIEREDPYNVPLVNCHIGNIEINGDPASPCLTGINYTGFAWQKTFTLDIDLARIKNCMQTITGAKLGIQMLDDTVHVISLGNVGFLNGMIMIWCHTSTTAPAPQGLLKFRVGTSPAIVQVAMASTTNIVTTTGVLTGTTGTDGNFTISAHTDGKLYFENRAGAERVIGIKLIGPA